VAGVDESAVAKALVDKVRMGQSLAAIQSSVSKGEGSSADSGASGIDSWLLRGIPPPRPGGGMPRYRGDRPACGGVGLHIFAFMVLAFFVFNHHQLDL